MSTRRVVVTGLGTVSPLGHSAKESWQSAIAGKSGVGPITLFDASEMDVQIACEVKDFDPTKWINYKDARRRDRFENMASAAAKEAIEASGIQFNGNTDRTTVIVSSAIGGIGSLEEAVHILRDQGHRRVSPFGIVNIMPNGASGMIAIDYGIHGAALSVASACASSSDGIGQAWLHIRAGLADVAITGGAEATVTPVAVAAFDRLGAMSRRDPNAPVDTPSPFSKDRDGLVMGEGSAVLVLEELEYAKKRGATILAELAGYAATSDAFHVTAPADDGAGGAQAITNALGIAGVNVDGIDYINAHGTATQLNDLSETLAIKKALGEEAYNVAISSTKSMTGHMMGATGSLEATFCVNAIYNNIVPPTINYREQDPDCDLDYVPNKAREMPVRVAISNSFGFGGHNSVLVFKEFTD